MKIALSLFAKDFQYVKFEQKTAQRQDDTKEINCNPYDNISQQSVLTELITLTQENCRTLHVHYISNGRFHNLPNFHNFFHVQHHSSRFFWAAAAKNDRKILSHHYTKI